MNLTPAPRARRHSGDLGRTLALLLAAAITFASVSPATAQILLDNSQSGFSAVGTWSSAATYGPIQGSNYVQRAAGSLGQLPTGALVVDNTDPGFSVSGSWSTATNRPGYIGANFRINLTAPTVTGVITVDNNQTDNTAGVGGTVAIVGAWELHTEMWAYEGINFLLSPPVSGNGANSVTWTPNVASTGQYQVYMRQGLAPYGQTPPRATNAPFTINHANGSTTVLVNHQNDLPSTAYWGTWSPNNGPTGKVIGWVYLGTYPFNAGTAGNIVAADNANGRVVADAVRLEPLPYAVAARWAAPVTQAGSYKLYVRFPDGNDLARDTKYFVTHAAGETVAYLDQRQNGGAQWRYLGTWNFTPGQGHKVTLPAGPVTNGLSADAIAWVPANAPISYDLVAWNPAQAGIAAGTYQVEVNWLRFASQGYAPTGSFGISHAGGTTQATVAPNPATTGSWGWQSLGTYTFNAPAHEIRLSTQGMDTLAVAADAVRLTLVSGTSEAVSLTSPSNGQGFTAPAAVNLAATATAPTGASIQGVSFYNGETLIGSGTLNAGSWGFAWASVAQGSYSITARATDSVGNTTTSAAVAVNVNPGGGTNTAAGIYFIEADHLGTPRRITNASQQVVWRWDPAEPFGDTPADENPSGLGNFEFNPRFPGQYRDKETNLRYNFQRNYDAGMGRYVQSDPIGLRGGINTYLYVNANPLIFSDVSGMRGGPGIPGWGGTGPILFSPLTVGVGEIAGLILACLRELHPDIYPPGGLTPSFTPGPIGGLNTAATSGVGAFTNVELNWSLFNTGTVFSAGNGLNETTFKDLSWAVGHEQIHVQAGPATRLIQNIFELFGINDAPNDIGLAATEKYQNALRQCVNKRRRGNSCP